MSVDSVEDIEIVCYRLKFFVSAQLTLLSLNAVIIWKSLQETKFRSKQRKIKKNCEKYQRPKDNMKQHKENIKPLNRLLPVSTKILELYLEGRTIKIIEKSLKT